ncbi:hypothetical protein D3C86_1043060 [compost metagenome]
MTTREIERSKWNDYMASLTNMCLNRPVTIQVNSEELGDQVVVERAPFLGMAPELKGSEACSVDIEVGKAGSTDAFMHEVKCADRVMVREDDKGTPLAIDIEGEDPASHVRIKTILTWV